MTTLGLRRWQLWRHAAQTTALCAMAMLVCTASGAAAEPAPAKSPTTSAASSPTWTVGTPIVTYWAGPAMTDAAAKQIAEGGFNLVWCGEKDLDLVRRHGLRAQLNDGLLSPATLDNPAQREKLDALIARVAKHPAMYCYFITDEPGAGAFAALGKLVAYLSQRDPAHMAYINLFPTYASNEQLGTKGDMVTAYREHLRQFVDVVRPALVSYDHYQFAIHGDSDGYFLNLAMIRRAADEAKAPFVNIVQACTWAPTAMRAPKPDEVRYLVYSTAAYGASGISYYVYGCAGHVGGIASLDGTPTPLYHALKSVNREFVAITSQTQPLGWLGAFHTGMTPPGAVGLPADAAFRLDPPVTPIQSKPQQRVRGILLGLWGPPAAAGAKAAASHVLVVNMDYQAAATTTVVGPGPLETFDALAGKWSPAGSQGQGQGNRAPLQLPPGSGVLLRVKR